MTNLPAKSSGVGKSPPDPNIIKNSNERMFVTDDGRNVLLTFVLLLSLFTLWGFCTGIIDVMDKHFQEQLHLSLSESAWVQFAHYLGYFLMALPAGWLATKLGYKIGIMTGLLMVALGGFWFIPATHIASFWAFLLGVGIIAAGLAFLETIANPYTTILGTPRYAAARINLAQSCNGIGLLCGPIVGGIFFYSTNQSGVSTGSERIWIPYAGIAIVVLILTIVFYYAEVPDIKADEVAGAENPESTLSRSIWSQPHFVMAVAAQFFYIAAQAGIFSFLINYMTSQTPNIPASWDAYMKNMPGCLHDWTSGWFTNRPGGGLVVSDKGAANCASLGFLFFLIGRFSGAAILRKFSACKTLGIYAVCNVVLCTLIFCKLGWISVVCVFLSYFFMSIMYPTIFALGIHGLGQRAKKASSYLVMAIIGGAIVPKLMGVVADHTDLSRSYIVPMLCFLFIAVYAFMWPKLNGLTATSGQL